MYAGEVVEEGVRNDVLGAPAHPYTRGLLRSIPDPANVAPDGRLGTIPGTVPMPTPDRQGCFFVNRCRHARKDCHEGDVPEVTIAEHHWVRCRLLVEGVLRA